jgi:hypothetical protein
VERHRHPLTERVDRTLLWSLRIFGLVVLAIVGAVVLVTVIVFVAAAVR